MGGQYSILIIFIALTILEVNSETVLVDPFKTTVWGPGLKPDVITLPVRYFFVHAVDQNGHKLKQSPPLPYLINIKGLSSGDNCHSSHDVIDRGDGSSIIRYKIRESCYNVIIEIKYNGTQVAKSPYYIKGTIHSEKCYCPKPISSWLDDHECDQPARITEDLNHFPRLNFSAIRENLIRDTVMPNSVSLCNYVVKNNEIFRKCYGKYVGFKSFMDATLLSITRLVSLPDIEFFINLGDWPLSKRNIQQKGSNPYPIFSWCGSMDSYDIVLPTYDITESTLESMGRVSLDVLSMQRQNYEWNDKIEKAFWRGRDSRRERLSLIDISRQHPVLINASITNFFFFLGEENLYGPKAPRVPFSEFFKYKYQVNIDGVVAAYRLPYLLSGNSLVFKQESPFYEHFYGKLIPNKHYIPFKRDLSDLVEKINWARANDARAKEIAKFARQFVNENLLPIHIYCYHVSLFYEWKKRLVSPVTVQQGMEKVENGKSCICKLPNQYRNDEL